MKSSNTEPDKSKFNIAFYVLSVLLCLIFAAISYIGREFRYENDSPVPIVLITTLYMAASLIALTALTVGLQTRFSRKRWFTVILLVAASLRCVQIFSPPVLEVDLYRYMWDGIVLNEGISPYRYSPQEALDPSPVTGEAAQRDVASEQLREIQQLAIKTPTIHTIAQRVHFKEYSTIYPPTSQIFFAVSMWVTPDRSSVEAHLFSMKLMLTLFDLATVLLVWKLVSVMKLPSAWVLAYAWNPLVIKEIANSGHLDSIAVFFLTLAIFGVVQYIVSWRELSQTPNRWVATAAVALAAGVGAKIFPIVLAPIIVVTLFRIRGRAAFLFALIFGVASVAILAPMLLQNKLTQNLSSSKQEPTTVEQTKEGLSSFLTQWRMNDLVFSCVYENAKADDDRVTNRPWYVVVPNERRIRWNQFLDRQGFEGSGPFVTARGVTLTALGIAYAYFCFLIWREPSPSLFLHLTFMVIATFFFLQPTQNPWYWVWAMPFVCFVRNRGWLIVSVALFSYYFRFWFEGHEGSVYWMGIEYQAAGIFDYLGVFLEFGIVFVTLISFRVWKFGSRFLGYGPEKSV